MQASCQSPPAGEEEGLRALETGPRNARKMVRLPPQLNKIDCIKVVKIERKKEGFSLIGKKGRGEREGLHLQEK